MDTQCILSYLNALLIYGSVSTGGNYHSNRRLVLCLVVKHSVVWATKLYFGMDVQQNNIWETLGAHYLEYGYHSIMFVISCGAHYLKYCSVTVSPFCTSLNSLFLQLVLPRKAVPLSFTHQPSWRTTNGGGGGRENEGRSRPPINSHMKPDCTEKGLGN